MPIPGLLEEHAEEAAFLWLLRDQAALAPDYDRLELAALEGRLLAHLDGLTLSGDAAWLVGRAQFEEWPEVGEAFVAGVLALGSGDRRNFDAVLQIAATDESALRGVRGALAWSPLGAVQPLLDDLVASSEDQLRTIGLAAFGAHRTRPAASFTDALRADDPTLAAQAARTAAQLGMVEALPSIAERRATTGPENGGLLFWCAWSSVLLGDRDSCRILQDSAPTLGSYAAPACELLGRALEGRDARSWQHSLRDSGQDGAIELALRTAAASGQVGLLPWILEQMHDPSHAQSAGDAFHRITGVDLVEADLVDESPVPPTDEDTDSDPESDVEADDRKNWRPEDDLPRPDAQACTVWFQHSPLVNEHEAVLLVGHPKSNAEALRTTIDSSAVSQRNRHDAAIELSLSQPSEPLHEVRARVG